MKLSILSTQTKLLYSGFDDGFWQFNYLIKMPKLDIHVKFSNLQSLEKLDEVTLNFVIEKLKQISKNISLNSISYKYQSLSVYYAINEEFNILGIFAMGETQPAKYEIYSLGFFKSYS